MKLSIISSTCPKLKQGDQISLDFNPMESLPVLHIHGATKVAMTTPTISFNSDSTQEQTSIKLTGWISDVVGNKQHATILLS